MSLPTEKGAGVIPPSTNPEISEFRFTALSCLGGEDFADSWLIMKAQEENTNIADMDNIANIEYFPIIWFQKERCNKNAPR